MPMDLRRISEQNPWWTTGSVRDELCPPYERRALADVVSSLTRRYVTLVRGPRRTGKSTMLYQAIRHLLKGGIDPATVLYFSFDGEPGTIQELLDEYRISVLGRPFDGPGRVHVFLDEVQKCRGWSEDVKRNHDLYPNVKFVLSGSVSFDMGRGTTESLVGRARETVLLPMSFAEYLGLRGLRTPAPGEPLRRFLLAETTVQPYFSHYLASGGFPELATEDDAREMREYVLSSIVQRAVYGDLFGAGGIGDPESMMALLRAISEMPGMLLNYDSLGSSIGRDRRTVSSYIARLEQAMVIRTLGNLRGSALASSRKHRKAYPVSTALTYAFKGAIADETDLGRVVETAVLNEIDARHFWREHGAEVDFVVGARGTTAVEVKLSGEGGFPFDELAKARRLDRAFVVTRSAHGPGMAGGTRFERVPAWALCAGAHVPGIRGAGQ